MKKNIKNLSVILLLFSASSSFAQVKVSNGLKYCEVQALRTLKPVPKGEADIPRSITPGTSNWPFRGSIFYKVKH